MYKRQGSQADDAQTRSNDGGSGEAVDEFLWAKLVPVEVVKRASVQDEELIEVARKRRRQSRRLFGGGD